MYEARREPESSTEPPYGEMSGRDAEIVRAIEDEGVAVFTFDGLRRVTGSHPETLSRALDRLEADGLVVRSPEGYSATSKSKAAVRHDAGRGPARSVPILFTFLPYATSLGTVVAALKGKWFGKMRWFGMSEGAARAVMKWVSDDGQAILEASLSPGELHIEARITKDSELPGAILAAHQLVGRISQLYAGSRPATRHAPVRVGYFMPLAM